MTETKTNIELVKEEPKKERIRGLTGITNTGNTCYMNSALQALSHNYPLTKFLFMNEKENQKIIIKNTKKVVEGLSMFDPKNKANFVPIELRNKIADDNFNPDTLTESEINYVYNASITGQLTRLLKQMWAVNCDVVPISFRLIFSEVRNKFFFSNIQHDAEEAYSCIIQKMQEELAVSQHVKFETHVKTVNVFIARKNNIARKIPRANNAQRLRLQKEYMSLVKNMPKEALIMEAFRNMKRYYTNNHSQITEIFTGFCASSTRCPKESCNHSSYKFEPFLHLPLSIPAKGSNDNKITIMDCLDTFCKEEKLDANNMWKCDGCGDNVQAILKTQLWSAPPILVVQLKRFGYLQARKDNRLIDYPLDDFDISSMIMEENKDPSKCYKYRLQSVVNHTGGLHGGHYYSFCMDEDTGKWFCYNDAMVQEININKIVTPTAYLLFFMRKNLIK